MSTPPPIPPAEAFATFVRWLGHAVVTRHLVGLLAGAVASYLINHLRDAKQRLARLAARVAAGTFAPRRVAARREPEQPRQKIPRRQPFGWLRPLLPDAVAAAGHLAFLLQDPEMVALMQAAPAQTARIFRPLCWMLRIKPPPILALPRRKATPQPPPPATTPAAATEAPAPQIPPPITPPRRAERPARLARPARRACRACGPPHPA